MSRRSIIVDDHGKPIRDGVSKRVLVFPDMDIARKWAEVAFGDSKTTYIEPLEPISSSVTRDMRVKLRQEEGEA